MQDYVVYDVEVLRDPREVDGGWDNPEAMGFGCAVAYASQEDRYRMFGLGEQGLEHLRMLLTVARSHGWLLVGFNNVLFDNRVIYGNGYRGSTEKSVGEEAPGDVDLMLRIFQAKFAAKTLREAQEKYGHRTVHDGSCGLDALCMATLGRGKTGHGAKAPVQIRERDYSGVFAYNLEDVRLARDLYLFGLRYGYVIDGAGNRIAVNFS